MPLPEKFANPPELRPGLEIFYIGFIDLMGSRQIGMGMGPIWWSTVQDYCERKGLDDEQTEEMHHHIQAMDTLYLKSQEKKSRGNNRSVQPQHPQAGKSNPKRRG